MALADTPKLGKLSTSLNVNGICCAMAITSAYFYVKVRRASAAGEAKRFSPLAAPLVIASYAALQQLTALFAASARSTPLGWSFYPRPLFCHGIFFLGCSGRLQPIRLFARAGGARGLDLLGKTEARAVGFATRTLGCIGR